MGISFIAVWVLVLSYSDFLLRIFDDTRNRLDRDARRRRFRGYALVLLGIAIVMVIGSQLIAEVAG